MRKKSTAAGKPAARKGRAVALPEWKKCPICRTEMELKAIWGADEEGQHGYEMYQCPKCKNIEVL